MKQSPPIEELLSRARLYHLHTYLVVNRPGRLRVYYAPGSEQAAFIAPPEVMVRDEGKYRVRDLILNENPWLTQDGLPVLKMRLDGGHEELFSATNIDKLLSAGENAVYTNDREAVLVPGDFAELEKSASLATGTIFKSLVESGYWPADGVLTTRDVRLMQEEDLVLPPDLAALKGDVQVILDGIRRRSNRVAARYHKPAGLFNFGKSGVNFAPAMGRGEHNVYFEFFIGNRYGSFTPYSFLEAVKDPELSVAVYRELVQTGEILNERGRLADASRIRGLRELKCIDDPQMLEGIIRILEAARPPDIDEMCRDIASNSSVIHGEIRANESLPGLDRLTVPDLPAYIKAMSTQNQATLLRYYREARMNREIETEIIKNRGVVLEDDSADILLLVTDPVVRTAPYYTLLLDFFRETFPHASDVRIAYAYCKPGPRNVHGKLHPVVQAFIGLSSREDELQ